MDSILHYRQKINISVIKKHMFLPIAERLFILFTSWRRRSDLPISCYDENLCSRSRRIYTK